MGRITPLVLLLACGLALLLVPSPGKAAANAPTEFLAVASSPTTVELKWSKGEDTPITVVNRSTGGYPAEPSSGTLVYMGELSSCTDTGLVPGQTYYYRAWATDWESPVAFNETGWESEVLAYDENVTSDATKLAVPADSWSPYLELLCANLSSGGVRIYAEYDVAKVNQVDIEIYYSTAWHDVYSGAFPDITWDIHYMDSIATGVTRLGARFYNDDSSPANALCFEVDFLKVSTTEYDSDMVTLPLAGEPESPDIEGPEQPSQWFQVPNPDLLDSIPGSDLIDDAGDALGFPQGSMWVMVLVTVAIMFGTGAQVFFHNTLIAIGVGTVAMALFGIVGILPLWIMFVFVIMGIGTSYAIARM